MLAVALNLDFLLENYVNYKKDYCYELAEENFNNIKDDLDEKHVKIALKKKVKQNKLWNAIFIGTIPVSFLTAFILFCSNVSLMTSLTCAGVMIFTSLPITLPCIGYTSFEIDVLCEIIEKIVNSKNSTKLANIKQKNITFEEEIAKLTYNHGISPNRYKYVPEALKTNYIEIIVPEQNSKKKIRR